MKILHGLMLLSFTLSAAAVGEPAYEDIIEASLEKHVRPAVQSFSLATQQLHQSIEEQCASGALKSNRNLEDDFREAVRAWSYVHHLKWGPARVDYRHERISFGADPANYVSRQLSKLILDKDAEVLKVGEIYNRSIAVQGFTALEILITTEIKEADREIYACELAAAISLNIVDISKALDSEWRSDEGYVSQLRKPTLDHPIISSNRHAAMEFFKPLAGGLRFLIDMDLKDPLQSSLRDARPLYLSYFRTESTKVAVDAKLKGLQDLYLSGGFKGVLELEKPELNARIERLFDKAIEINNSIDGTYFEAVQNSAGRNKIQKLADVLDELWYLIVYDLAEHFDFIVGFNQFDGD